MSACIFTRPLIYWDSISTEDLKAEIALLELFLLNNRPKEHNRFDSDLYLGQRTNIENAMINLYARPESDLPIQTYEKYSLERNSELDKVVSCAYLSGYVECALRTKMIK